MNITIRGGEPKDTYWIVSLLKEGAQGGHFSPTVVDQSPAILNAIFENGGFVMLKLRGGIQAPTFVPAEIAVAEIDGEGVSFLIILREGNNIELHLAATKRSARRKGCFKKLILYAVEQHNKRKRLFARCYKKSSWAIEGLKKEGFTITKDGDPIELSLNC